MTKVFAKINNRICSSCEFENRQLASKYFLDIKQFVKDNGTKCISDDENSFSFITTSLYPELVTWKIED